jgi:membrane-associated phospholipid phosphatase
MGRLWQAEGVLRASERLAVSYFLYCCGCSVVMPVRAGVMAATFAVNLLVIAGFLILAWAEGLRRRSYLQVMRDWYPLPLMLLAYREMGWFAPETHSYRFEHGWVVWDRMILNGAGLRGMIESMGAVLPAVLEISYSLVYAIAPFCMGWLYYRRRQGQVSEFHLQFLASIFLAYALNPFFPSEPPRTVFPGEDLPGVITVFRELNLALVGNYGIHLSVFPSAHCSGAFGAALAMRRLAPDAPWLWRLLLLLAVSIATATVYGRYHYAVDAVAGFGIAAAAAAACHRRGRGPTEAGQQSR